MNMWKKAAWTAIVEKLKIKGKAAKVIWANLEKFLSKRRIKLQEVDIFGAKSVPAQKTLRACEELNFFIQFISICEAPNFKNKFHATKRTL